MKVSDFIVQKLADSGIDVCFSVTGGGAMHLNDSFGENTNFQCIYMHHEQAAAMAAEGYARIAGKPAVVNVTTGPGAINALNGIFGAYTDSIPMIIIAGQVRTDTISTNFDLPDLRQLGDQELRSMPMVKEITKFSFQVNSSNQVADALDEAIKLANSGRPGPVWLEIPVNIQGEQMPEIYDSKALSEEKVQNKLDRALIETIAEKIKNSHRPIIMAGTGVSIADAKDELIELAKLADVPIVTAWTHDLIDSSNEYFAGRPGTIGTRPGNFAVQFSDLLLVIGSRLNIRQVSYNWEAFAPHAEIIWIDIDKSEFEKPFVKADIAIQSDAKDFILALINECEEISPFSHNDWRSWCQEIRNQYEPKESDYISTSEGINAYHLIPSIFDTASEQSIFVCGNATACIVPFQVGNLKKGMRLFSNSGSASMGYDLPAAIGAAIAEPNKKIICFAGDGSIMMNLQELQTLAHLGLNVSVIVLDNDGYLSIKQTQTNFFGHDHGASPKSGVTFPNFESICSAFGIKTTRLSPSGNWKKELEDSLTSDEPSIIVAPLEVNQEFIPRLKSRIIDGKIQTPSLEDMFPHLPDDEMQQIKDSALSI